MAGSDMYVGWVDASNVLTLLDTHSTGQSIPTVDTTNNILQSSGSQVIPHILYSLFMYLLQVNSVTTFSFVRHLNTGDSNDLAVGNSTLYVLYAMGTSDGDANKNYAQHSSRGSGQVNFMSGNSTSNNDTNVNNNVTIISVNSTGNCKCFITYC